MDRHTSTPAVAAFSSTFAPTSGKLYGSTVPEVDVQKRQRRTYNTAAAALLTPMSSPTPGRPATVPSAGSDRRDDVAVRFVQHGAVDLFALQREQVLVGESRRVDDEFVHEVHGLHDRVARLEGQLDLLLRVLRLVASPTLPTQAPRDPPAMDQGKANAI
uniref:Uncharacterized protein n=1 Tax=Peronospora matthiolae TaxID=2874970 RepID=A0AAV1TI19_9STRA